MAKSVSIYGGPIYMREVLVQSILKKALGANPDHLYDQRGVGGD